MQSTVDLLMGKYDEPARQSTPVSKFYHTTCFGINEKGTQTDETAAPDTLSGTGSRRILNIKYDHPFLYFVIAKQQQVVLFSGVLNNPGIVTKPDAKPPSRPAGLHLPHGIGHRRSQPH